MYFFYSSSMKHFFLSLLLYCAVSSALAQPNSLSIAAKSYLLSDFQTGQTLASQNAHEQIEPASLTKLMTAYVVFSALKQHRLELNQAVPVSQTAWKLIGSRMFLGPNKQVTVDELIRGMIVQSGNDACIALAEAVAGSEANFTGIMNKEAARLGSGAGRGNGALETRTALGQCAGFVDDEGVDLAHVLDRRGVPE